MKLESSYKPKGDYICVEGVLLACVEFQIFQQKIYACMSYNCKGMNKKKSFNEIKTTLLVE